MADAAAENPNPAASFEAGRNAAGSSFKRVNSILGCFPKPSPTARAASPGFTGSLAQISAAWRGQQEKKAAQGMSEHERPPKFMRNVNQTGFQTQAFVPMDNISFVIYIAPRDWERNHQATQGRRLASATTGRKPCPNGQGLWPAPRFPSTENTMSNRERSLP